MREDSGLHFWDYEEYWLYCKSIGVTPADYFLSPDTEGCLILADHRYALNPEREVGAQGGPVLYATVALKECCLELRRALYLCKYRAPCSESGYRFPYRVDKETLDEALMPKCPHCGAKIVVVFRY